VKALEAGHKRVNGWLRASRAGDIKRMQALLAYVRVDSCLGEGTTALHNASRRGDAAACEWLLAQGADPIAADRHGSTPLHELVGLGAGMPDRIRAARALLKATASLDARCNRSGCTPLELARRYNAEQETLYEVVRNGAMLQLLESAARLRYLMRRWRLAARIVQVLSTWHARATETAYMPNGGGFAEARADFEGHAAKLQRIEKGQSHL